MTRLFLVVTISELMNCENIQIFRKIVYVKTVCEAEIPAFQQRYISHINALGPPFRRILFHKAGSQVNKLG